MAKRKDEIAKARQRAAYERWLDRLRREGVTRSQWALITQPVKRERKEKPPESAQEAEPKAK